MALAVPKLRHVPLSSSLLDQIGNTPLLRLAKLDADYDPHDKIAAMSYLQAQAAKGELVTGLIYMDRNAGDLHANLNTVDTPLNVLSEKQLCPGAQALEGFNASHR